MKERPKVLITEHAEGRADGVRELVEMAGAQGEIIRLYQGIKNLSSYEYDAIVVTGGPMGVHEIDKPEYRFLRQEEDYLSNIIARGKAVLGICLGHQLVAHVLGGRIEVSPKGSEVGWTKILINSAGQKDQIFLNMPDEFWSFQYHHDEVVALPSGAINLASSGHCNVQAFRQKGSLVWGVQFHPEVSPEKAKKVLEARKEILDQQGIDVVMATKQGFSVSHKPRTQIFINFINALK